ncbi:MAG: nitroreductase family protein [Clostridium sp.]
MLTEIWTRQSIRRYEDRTVEKEKLEELLRAAMHAPTARIPKLAIHGDSQSESSG